MIHTRRLTAARKTEDAWEAERARPIRELLAAGSEANLYPWEIQKEVRAIQEKNWPLKNKTKRGFLVWGVTKSMRSRARRQLNEITVAD
jgi:hypothetical protein